MSCAPSRAAAYGPVISLLLALKLDFNSGPLSSTGPQDDVTMQVLPSGSRTFSL